MKVDKELCKVMRFGRKVIRDEDLILRSKLQTLLFKLQWRKFQRLTTLSCLCMFFMFSCLKTPVMAHSDHLYIDLRVIAQIESSNNPKAYNKRTRATGLYQITPICLKDYNQSHKVEYSLIDMYDPKKARIVASWYLGKRIPQMLKHYKQPITIDTILWAYNAGIGLVVKGILPVETQNYIAKYERITND